MNNWTGTDLVTWYDVLHRHFGHQGWWPAETPFETIIGAILAQNVSWSGAHQAVVALADAGLMDPVRLQDAGPEKVAPLIRSSRYYNQKAQKISTFLHWYFDSCNGTISKAGEKALKEVRSELLSLKGFGPETVDSILLYALEKPVFVVDAYTRRIGSRQGWFSEKTTYDEMQHFFMSRISPDISLYNDFHAQIVLLGNQICRKTPRCDRCPVRTANNLPGCKYPGINKMDMQIGEK